LNGGAITQEMVGETLQRRWSDTEQTQTRSTGSTAASALSRGLGSPATSATPSDVKRFSQVWRLKNLAFLIIEWQRLTARVWRSKTTHYTETSGSSSKLTLQLAQTSRLLTTLYLVVMW